MLVTSDCVNFSYGGNLIISEASFVLHEGGKVGLVGENGAGKTTLLKLILGALSPDSGSLVKKNGASFGYLEQNGGYTSGNSVYEEMRLAFSEELAAVERLAKLSEELAACNYKDSEYARISAKIESLNKYVASHDAYSVDVKIKTVLGGMGFGNSYNRIINTMSGGEKTRLKLARLLLENPDLLILDEPTNHLDLQTLSWLEEYLKGFKGALLVVSHDRYFLDRVTDNILEIENKRVYRYKGNYTKYKYLKEQRIQLEQKEYEQKLEEAQRLQTYVDKNIVRATTAKSAQSRVKQLEKLQIPPKPYLPPKPPRFNFKYSQRPAEEVLKICGLTLTAGGKTLLKDASLNVLRGQKIAVVGANGAGKSTLIKAIVCGGNPQIKAGRFVNFSYYDQEAANLSPQNTVLEELWQRHVIYSQTEARASLARCGLYPEDMQKKVCELSGGERAKLALCVFGNEGGNVLVLDEPTNHLDLPARESLEKSLKDFDGTVIFVSHDRYFISAVADTVAELEDFALRVYGGGYEGYKKSKQEEEAAKQKAQEAAAAEEFERRKESAYRSKKDRSREARQKAEIKAIEADILRAERRQEEITSLMATAEIATNYSKLAPLLEETQQIKNQLDELYARYGELIG